MAGSSSIWAVMALSAEIDSLLPLAQSVSASPGTSTELSGTSTGANGRSIPCSTDTGAPVSPEDTSATPCCTHNRGGSASIR